MSPKLKVIVLIIAVLISLSLAGGEYYLFQKEHSRNIELSAKIEDLSAKQKEAEAKFVEARKTLSALESKFKDATAQLEALNSQLQQEKSDKEMALNRMEQMKAEFDQQKSLRSDLENKLNQAQTDVKNIQSKLGALEAQKETLENKVKELETKANNVELGKIVVTPETAAAPAPAPQKEKVKKVAKPAVAADKEKVAETVSAPGVNPGQEGKVLVLNKEYNFIVINIGGKDGVAVGDKYSVMRGNKNLGEVQVEKVQEAMSAAGFLTEGLINKVKEGDKVVKKNK